MKTKFLTTFGILFLAIGSLVAQEKGQTKAEQKRAEKIAFISTKLELTPEEAEKFWPVYNEFEDKMKALHKEHRKNKPEKKVPDMTDEEVEALVQGHFDFEQRELNLKKEYHEKFKKVLPVKKVAKLYHLEMEFRRQKKGKDGHDGRPPHPPEGGPMPPRD